MRSLIAAPFLLAAVALSAPATAGQRQSRADPAPEAQERQGSACNVRQDVWGSIAPAPSQQPERARRDPAACSKRHLIDWTPPATTPVGRAK
jgi:hypothetical protein